MVCIGFGIGTAIGSSIGVESIDNKEARQCVFLLYSYMGREAMRRREMIISH